MTAPALAPFPTELRVGVPEWLRAAQLAAPTQLHGRAERFALVTDLATRNVEEGTGGPFAATYAQSWQPYPDGMGGKYWSGKIISAHDGSMDVAMDGEHGAAGTFGTPTGAWTHVGGTFSIRARATGGGDNGLAVMLWPTSDDWSEGELNYPEGNFDGAVHAFHHLMVPGHEQEKVSYTADVSWRDWHTYTTQWVPGKYVRYYLDGKLVMSVTHDVPTTPHRYMFQIGNWGSSGHLMIDWVRTWDRT